MSRLGFSQGTILSTAYALNHPDKIKHVIALSGYVNQELIQKPIEKGRYFNQKKIIKMAYILAAYLDYGMFYKLTRNL